MFLFSELKIRNILSCLAKLRTSLLSSGKGLSL